MPVSDIDVDDEIEAEEAIGDETAVDDDVSDADGAGRADDATDTDDATDDPDHAIDDATEGEAEGGEHTDERDADDATDDPDHAIDDATDTDIAIDAPDTEVATDGALPGWQRPEGESMDAIDAESWGIVAGAPAETSEDSTESPGWQPPEDGDGGPAGSDDETGDDAADDEVMADDVDEADAPPTEEPDLEHDATIDLDRIIGEHLVTMMYQPIASLLDDSVVGYEALVRGPKNSDLTTPAEMFAAAAAEGRLKDLDLLCQDQAVVQAKDVLLKSGHALFVNAEPSVLLDAALGRDPDAAQQVSSLLTNITSACPVVLEISASHDYATPAELLAVTIWARAQGFRVALDDVAVDTRHLAMLPLIEPDVIKLARSVLSAPPDEDLGLLLRAVRLQSERTGAAVVCQGIESDADHDLALAMGATHAEGFGIGLPEELSEAPIRIRSLEPVGASWGEPCSTPFELVANSPQLRTAHEDLILALTLDLERQAVGFPNACILSAFERMTPDATPLVARYQKISRKVDFTVLIGTALKRRKGVFQGEVESTDALCSERAVVVLAPHFSAALLARLAGGGEGDRQFAYALSYDRGIVTRAARMLMAYIELD